MNKNQRYKLFLDAVKIIRSLADVLETIADTYKDATVIESDATIVEVEEVKTLPTKDKEITLEDVRAVLAVKSQNGLTAEVRGLITKYGGSKLSDIDPKHYADIIKDAEVLGDG